MYTLVIQLLISLVGVAFLIQMAFPKRRAEWIDSLNVSLMAGFIGMGLIAYAVLPRLTTTVELPFFAPHAYNLILWSALALVVLRPRFQARYLLPIFIMVYALDELLWNGLAVAYYWGQWKILTYVFLPDWHEFIGVLVAAGVVCYLIARPSIKPSITWAILAGFAFFWAWVAGFPVLAATNILSLDFQQTAYRLAWEVMWQLAFWGLLVYESIRPKTEETMPPLPRPFVG